MKRSISRHRLVAATAAALSIWFTSRVRADVLAPEDWQPIWSTSSLSLGRYALAGAATNNVAMFGGGSVSGNNFSNRVDYYNGTTNSWGTLSLSQGRYHLAAAATGNKILFGGGQSVGDGVNPNPNSAVVDIFDATTLTRTTATLSQPRWYLSAAATNGKVVFAGGMDNNFNYSNVVDIYDVASNTWSTAALSVARRSLAATAMGTKIYFGGGYQVGGSQGYSNRVDIYDTVANTWSTASLSQSRGELAATAVNGKVFFGGGAIPNIFSDRVDVLDVSSNTWTTGTLAGIRYGLAATSVGNKALFGGGGPQGFGDVVDIFDTSTLVQSASKLSVNRLELAAASVGNKAFFAGGGANTAPFNASRVDIYRDQIYADVLSAQNFTLEAHTSVTGRMQLNAPGSLNMGGFDLTVGSMSGAQPINLQTRNLTVGSDNTSATYSGSITGSGGINKIGDGALTFAGNNTYNSATNVFRGTLLVAGSITNSPINVNGGGTIGGSGIVGRTLNVAGGTSALTRGGIDLVDAAVSTLLFNDSNAANTVLTIGGNLAGRPTLLEFEVGAAADRLAALSGKVKINIGGGVIEITPITGFDVGIYPLMTFEFGQASGLENLTLATTSLPGGYTLSLLPTPTAEYLVVVPEAAVGVLLPLAALALRRRRVR